MCIYIYVLYTHSIIYKKPRRICSQVWKNLYLLSERLASLGVKGTHLRAPLNPYIRKCCDAVGAFRGILNWASMMPGETPASRAAVRLTPAAFPVCTQRIYFPNLIKSTRNQIVFNMHRLI